MSQCCALLRCAVPNEEYCAESAQAVKTQCQPYSHAAELSKCIAGRIKAGLFVVFCAMLSVPIVSDDLKDPKVQQSVCARRCR